MSTAYQKSYPLAAEASTAERSQFLRRTYMHLAGALLAFIAIEAVFVNTPIASTLTSFMYGSKWVPLIIMGLFLGVSWLANSWALSGTSKALQYAGLGVYVLAMAILVAPILGFTVHQLHQPNLIAMAGMITMGLFLGLTGVVVTTKKDFSFLAGIVSIGFWIALAFIGASYLFGFSLGNLFIAALVLLAGGMILAQTSATFYRYSTGQYVAAALGLFASVTTLFFYILQFLIGRRD